MGKTLTQPLEKLLPTHENIYTLPNFLTLTRLIAAPAVGYLLAYGQYHTALGLFLYAGITDLVDGWIARRWNMQTVLGTIVDPMADKALMTIVVVVLGVKGALPGMSKICYLRVPTLLGRGYPLTGSPIWKSVSSTRRSGGQTDPAHLTPFQFTHDSR